MRIPLLLAATAFTAHGAQVLHYWDMDTLDTGVPTDVVGSVATTENATGGPVVLESASYGSAYTGSGNYLKSEITSLGRYLRADVYDETGSSPTAMDFGTDDWSFSYWTYDDFAADADVRGPRIFDNLMGTTEGIQMGTAGAGQFNFRIDDDAFNDVISNVDGGADFSSLMLTQDAWVHVAVNVSRSGNQVEVFFDGVSQGTYDISKLTGSVFPSMDLTIGSINGGTVAGHTQTGGLDDLAFYNGILTAQEVADLAAGTITPLDIDTPPPPVEIPPVAHYWDFDPTSGAAVDLYGDLDLVDSNAPTSFADLSEDLHYGQAFSGANESLNITLGSSDFLVGDSYNEGGSKPTHLDWGDTSFSFSYWAYDHSEPGTGGDDDTRGVRVFDCLAGDTVGITVNSNNDMPTGALVVRIDDDAGNSVVSNATAGFESVVMPAERWVHVAMNVDRVANELTIYLDGVAIPEGAIDISSLTGNIFCTTDLEIGVINGGGSAGTAQKCGIDELAFYPALLSQDQITALAGPIPTTTPLEVLVSMEPSGPIPIVSVEYDAGELAIEFTSESGKIYSVFGGPTLDDTAAWPEISTSDLIGDGTDLPFSHTPGVTPFFLQVRED